MALILRSLWTSTVAFLRRATHRHARIPRPPQAHIVSSRGTAHEVDGIPNQDASFVLIHPDSVDDDAPTTSSRPLRPARSLRQKFTSANTTLIAAVFDGHGEEGHVVAAVARHTMEAALLAHLAPNVPLQTSVRAAFVDVAAAVDAHPTAASSGTTASLLVIRANQAVVAYVGDSAVLVAPHSTSPRNALPPPFLTVMHRPFDPLECERVLAAGARVRGGYVVDEAGTNGISVTRTFGDVDMHRYGCISEPQVHTFDLTSDEVSFVLASDGFWDTPSANLTDIMSIVSSRRAHSPRTFCDKLLQLAVDDGGPIDDCTIICVSFRPPKL